MAVLVTAEASAVVMEVALPIAGLALPSPAQALTFRLLAPLAMSIFLTYKEVKKIDMRQFNGSC
jgi:hypothetical protein